MPPFSRPSWLEVEQIDVVTVVRFTRPDLLDEHLIHVLGGQLYDLVKEGVRHLVLNMSNIKRLSSAMISKLIGLHKRVQAAGGRMALCKIDPLIREVFEMLQLQRMVPIYAEEQEALQSVQ